MIINMRTLIGPDLPFIIESKPIAQIINESVVKKVPGVILKLLIALINGSFINHRNFSSGLLVNSARAIELPYNHTGTNFENSRLPSMPINKTAPLIKTMLMEKGLSFFRQLSSMTKNKNAIAVGWYMANANHKIMTDAANLIIVVFLLVGFNVA